MEQDRTVDVVAGPRGTLAAGTPPAASAVDPVPPPEDKSPGIWLIHLFLRPDAYVTSISGGIPILRVVFAALTAGAAWGLVSYLSPERRELIPPVMREAYLTGSMIGWAVFGGLLLYGVGGSWYVLRLMLCGARGFRHGLARRAYITIQLHYTLPCVFGL